MSKHKDWVLYKDRPSWSDVKPIPQDDGPQPVVAICYSEKFRDAYDYFRGILAIGEKSERALHLTRDCLELNSSNYTVWQYRRMILKECQFDLKTELDFVLEMIKNSEKNYQVWHHRRVIVDWLGDASAEDDVTRELLAADSKNYHAWQHRQWYIRTFNMFDGELEYTEEMLEDDIRNNSAWNQRYFVINNTSGFTEEVFTREINFTFRAILKVTENESAWNYLRGLYFLLDPNSEKGKQVKSFCEKVYQTDSRCRHVMAFLVDILAEEEDAASSIKAIELCQKLANDMDKIRCNYWNFMESRISSKNCEQLL